MAQGRTSSACVYMCGSFAWRMPSTVKRVYVGLRRQAFEALEKVAENRLEDIQYAEKCSVTEGCMRLFFRVHDRCLSHVKAQEIFSTFFESRQNARLEKFFVLSSKVIFQ